MRADANDWTRGWQQTSFLSSRHWNGILGCPRVLFPLIPIKVSTHIIFISLDSLLFVFPSFSSLLSQRKSSLIDNKLALYISSLYFISFSWIYLFFEPQLLILNPKKSFSEKQGEDNPLPHPQFHLPLDSLNSQTPIIHLSPKREVLLVFFYFEFAY